MNIARHARVFLILATICFVHFRRAALGLESPPAREAFLKLIDKPRVDPKVEVSDPVEADGLKTSHFWFNSEADERVPGIVVYPANANARLPIVIAMHGTGGKKESNLGLLKKLALKGCAAVAIDGRFHGERVKDLPGTDHYNQAILNKFKSESKGFPLYWDTVYDIMRLIDVLSAREDLDGGRIGLIGFSKGGIETYFAAAADPRISVAVPCIGVQSFNWGLENDSWHARVNTVKSAFEGAVKSAGIEKPDTAFARTFFDKVVPGIYGQFDGPVMLPLIAPRPLLMINGDSDANTPLTGVNICAEKAKAAYAKAGAEDKFKQIVEPHTPHKVNEDALNEAVEFFAKHLGF